MKRFFNRAFAAAALVFAVLVVGTATFGWAVAATPNYANVPITLLPIHLSGQYTTAESGVASYKMPAKMKLIGISAKARAASGVTDTLTMDVRSGATSVLSTPVAISASAVTEGAIVTSAIADEATLSVDLAASGVAPALNDISILLTLIPL